MTIEEKLDQAIEILLSIEGKLNAMPEQVPEPKESGQYKKSATPTGAQLEFQKQVEFYIQINRTHFLTAIRKNASQLMERRRMQPGYKISFKDEITLKLVDEKIAKTQAMFYKDLKLRLLDLMKAVEADGERTLDRAIAKLTARLK
jgi:hypothetical protein